MAIAKTTIEKSAKLLDVIHKKSVGLYQKVDKLDGHLYSRKLLALLFKQMNITNGNQKKTLEKIILFPKIFLFIVKEIFEKKNGSELNQPSVLIYKPYPLPHDQRVEIEYYDNDGIITYMMKNESIANIPINEINKDFVMEITEKFEDLVQIS